MLDSYRGSLGIYEWEFQGEYITFLNALKEAKAHLDILRVALQCVDDRHIDALASISCNWLVWSPVGTPAGRLTPALVEPANQSKLELDRLFLLRRGSGTL